MCVCPVKQWARVLCWQQMIGSLDNDHVPSVLTERGLSVFCRYLKHTESPLFNYIPVQFCMLKSVPRETSRERSVNQNKKKKKRLNKVVFRLFENWQWNSFFALPVLTRKSHLTSEMTENCSNIWIPCSPLWGSSPRWRRFCQNDKGPADKYTRWLNRGSRKPLLNHSRN